MKILMINAVWNKGSTGRNIAEMKRVMEADGNRVLVAATHLTEAGDGFFQIGSFADWKLHGLLSRLTGKQAFFSKSATRRLLKWIRKEKPDVVHLHNLHGNYIHLPTLLGFLAQEDIPTVITLHDCWFFTGKCVYYSAVGCEKWVTGCRDCPRLKADNPSWFFDRTASVWEEKKTLFRSIPNLGVIGVSDWILGEAKRSPFFSKAKSMERICNWVDLDLFRPKNPDGIRKKHAWDGLFIILGGAYIWEDRKGLDRFVRLAKTCKEDERVVLVGDVPQGDYPERLICLGRINDRRELAELYSAADVFCQFSTEESFGKVLAEALSCGTPAVAWRATANPELVPPECGFVAENETQLFASLAEIKSKGKAYYSAGCRAFAEKGFSMEERIKDHEDFYRRLISEKETRR